MEIGEPRRIYTVEPVEDPVPSELPDEPDVGPDEVQIVPEEPEWVPV